MLAFDAAFGKDYNASSVMQHVDSPLNHLKTAGPAFAVYRNVQPPEHVPKQGYLGNGRLPDKGVILPENNPHGRNIQIRGMIGAEYIGLILFKAAPEFSGDWQETDGKEQVPPQPVQVVSCPVPLWSLQKKKEKRKQDHEETQKPEVTPEGVKPP
jgi:hypothetical protein